MKNQDVRKNSDKNSQTARGYDLGVRSMGSGLEDHGELVAPEAAGDQQGPLGDPVWDDTELAPPPVSASPDGLLVPVSSNAVHQHLPLAELRKRAVALSIPGRAKMTKMALATAINNAVNNSEIS